LDNKKLDKDTFNTNKIEVLEKLDNLSL